MRTNNAADEKTLRMTTAPVEKLVCTLAVPTIASMLISSLYNMADTFFVGQLGTSATGAVGIVFSLMAVIQAIGFFFGHGSGNYISRELGAKRYENATKMASTGFFTALGFGVLIAVVGLVFMQPLALLLGATPTILPHALEYMRFILLGAPFMAASLVLNNLLRFQGSAVYGMIGMVSGAVLNIALDPLFIFVFEMGVAGAALATMISQIVSFSLLLVGSSRKDNIRISIRQFSPSVAAYREIARGGLPSLCRQGLGSVAAICINNVAGNYGDAAIAALSIVQRVSMFAMSTLLGFGQGFQPVCGFNYGARRYDRVRKALLFCIRFATLAALVFSVLGFIFAPQIISLFRRDDLEVIRIGALSLRFTCLVFPLSGWTVMHNMMLQTIGKAGKASLLAMARQGLFLLPLLFILTPIFGLLGLQLTQPAADIATFILAVPLGIGAQRELRRQEQAVLAEGGPPPLTEAALEEVEEVAAEEAAE